MALFNSTDVDATSMSPTQVATAIGIAITRYVDEQFPEVPGGFSSFIEEFANSATGEFGEQVLQAVMAGDQPGPNLLNGLPSFFFFPLICFTYAHDAIVADAKGDQRRAWACNANASYWLGLSIGGGVYDDIVGFLKTNEGRRKANIKHDKPGGSRDKKRHIQKIWASGKYESRDICAEQECAALDMSFSAARKALRNQPDPA